MALMNEPKMLLLDEPTAGINPTLINGIIDRLIKVNTDYGITLLVIEHNMRGDNEFSTKNFLFSAWQNASRGFTLIKLKTISELLMLIWGLSNG